MSEQVRRLGARRAVGALIVTFGLLGTGCSSILQSSADDPLLSASDTLPATTNVTEPGTTGTPGLTSGAEGETSIEIGKPEPAETPTTTTAAAAGTQTGQAGDDGSANVVRRAGTAKFSIVAQATVPALVARAEPDESSPTVADFTNPTASGAPLVFLAIEGGASSADWIEVLLPVQPNGTTGWIRRDEVELSDNPYRVEIDRAGHSLSIFYLNDLWLDTPVAIGTGDTPTPVGDFYLLELLQPIQVDGPYGPFAFGLSGFSEVLTSFGGADTAIIGIHGTNDPASLGSDVSSGCVRMDNELIEQLATTLPLGTPVHIT